MESFNLFRYLFKNFYFAFVSFKDPAHAKKAINELRYPVIRGFQCRVLPYSLKFAKVQSISAGDSSASNERNTYIFVKGFSKAKWSHQDLFNAFT